MITISFINASTAVTDDEAKQVMDALQIQVSRDFAPVWGVDASLIFVPSGISPAPGTWWLTVLDNSDQAGALGYHDITPDGLPIGKIFAGTDKAIGSSWSVTASHELLEMLGDPDINLTVLVDNILYAYEVGDAVEADELGYLINGVLVSDFVFPSWFETFRKPGTQFDFGGHVAAPLQLLPGGYIGYLDITSGQGWQQRTAEVAATNTGSDHVLRNMAALRKMRAPVGSRRERRRTPKESWTASTIHAA